MTSDQLSLENDPFVRPAGQPDLAWELLREHREDRIRLAALGHRPVGLGLNLLLWSLRAYVLFMLGVVLTNAVQIFGH